MPRRIVMSTIVTRCKQQCDQENATHILGPEWKARISERYGELFSIVNNTGLRYFESKSTITATGATSYNEVADIESTVIITRALGDGRELELAPLEPQEEPYYKGRTGDACRFSLIDDQLYLYPKPSSGTYNWYYRPQPPDLATFEDSDPVDVCCMAGLSFLIWGVAADALPKSESENSFAAKQADKYAAQLLDWAINRLATELPRQVVRHHDGLAEWHL